VILILARAGKLDTGVVENGKNMIKLIDLLKEEDFFTPRRSKEERSKNYNIAIQKKIQQYIKDGSQGNLDLYGTTITSLPNDLKVGGELDLRRSKIKTLPDNLKIKGDLYLNDTPIKTLPKGLEVVGDLDLTDTKIETLPNDLKVGGYLDLMHTPLAKKYTKQQFIRKMAPGVKGDIYL
jgi:hypothetical protein